MGDLLFYSFICPRCNFLCELYFGYYEVRIREATNDDLPLDYRVCSDCERRLLHYESNDNT